MAHISITPPGSARFGSGKARRKMRGIWDEAPLWVHVVIVAAGALLALGAVLVSANWPYRHRKIRPMLEDVLTSSVEFSNYHRVYFPRPGFIATGVTIRRKTAPPGLPPLGHIDTMMVLGTWSDLLMLRQRVELVDITGFHIEVPPIGSPENKQSFPAGSAGEFTGPDTMIERLLVHRSDLEIMRSNGRALIFPIKQLEITNLHKGAALTFAVDMENPIPRGHILAHGRMGPISGRKFDATPIAGNFAFTDVNLHDVGEICGILNARGVFKGSLESLHVETAQETRGFAISDGQPTPVESSMEGTLAATNGDLEIHTIELKIRGTVVQATGTIKGNPKRTDLDIQIDRGRAEDLLRPFLRRQVPITGPVSLRSHAYLGPPGQGFMERLRVTGSFDVPQEKVTDKSTERNLSAFSERAQGKRKPNSGVESGKTTIAPDVDAVSSISGPARISNGVASSSRIIFKVPGAEATLDGTFRFHDESVHLTGILKMDTDISHTATGFKSFLLKPLAPFFRKKDAGAQIPIAVTGLPGHYQISQDLAHNK